MPAVHHHWISGRFLGPKASYEGAQFTSVVYAVAARIFISGKKRRELFLYGISLIPELKSPGESYSLWRETPDGVSKSINSLEDDEGWWICSNLKLAIARMSMFFRMDFPKNFMR